MTENELIVLHLDHAFQKQSWHGTNLLGSIRGLRLDDAIWRPRPNRHNIWEIVVHTAYWKYAVYRRFVGESRGQFVLKGSNWFERPVEKSQAALKSDINLLKDYHRKLVNAVRDFGPRRFDDHPRGSKFTFRDLAIGAGSHDLYHAGQIQLIKRLKNA